MKKRSHGKILGCILTITAVIVFSFCLIISNVSGFSTFQNYILKAQHVALGMKHCYYDMTMYNHTEQVVGYILPGSTYEQTFYVPESLAESDEIGVSLKLATYDRINECSLSVTLRQEDQECTVTVDASELKDNSFQEFVFEDVGWLEEGYADIVIYSEDSDSENAVTLYTSDKILFYDYMICEGTETISNICMKVYIPF